MKKFWMTLVVMAVVFGMLAAPLSAVSLEGTGYLIARGNGRAMITGDIQANVHGDGVL